MMVSIVLTRAFSGVRVAARSPNRGPEKEEEVQYRPHGDDASGTVGDEKV